MAGSSRIRKAQIAGQCIIETQMRTNRGRRAASTLGAQQARPSTSWRQQGEPMAATTGSLLIRAYNPHETHFLHRIDCICFPPGIAYTFAELRFYLRHQKSVARVAEREGRIMGFVIGQVDGQAGHVVTLDILPEDRRHGTGSILMGALHAEFRDRKALVSDLEVSSRNDAAIRFYEKLGYRVVDFLPGYYGGSEDAYGMTLRLSK
jgi:ribosomal protein S18 acetylase RimI-like enzyme